MHLTHLRTLFYRRQGCHVLGRFFKINMPRLDVMAFHVGHVAETLATVVALIASPLGHGRVLVLVGPRMRKEHGFSYYPVEIVLQIHIRPHHGQKNLGY